MAVRPRVRMRVDLCAVPVGARLSHPKHDRLSIARRTRAPGRSLLRVAALVGFYG